MFRSLFPSFEKPVERPRYVNIEPESHEFSGVGVVLLLAASCGVALALWEPSHQVTSPFVTATTTRSAPTAAGKTAEPETIAAADSDDDQAQPTVKLSTVCSQRATARRDCADVKAIKDARLKSADPEPVPETVPAPTKQTKRAAVAAKAANSDQAAAPAAAPQVAAVTPPAPAAPAPRIAAVASKPAAVAPQTEVAVTPQTAPISSPPARAVTSPETPAAAPTQTAAVTPAIPAAAPPAVSDSPTETSSVTRPQAPAVTPPQPAAVPQAKPAAVAQAKPAATPRQTAASPAAQPRQQKTAAAAKAKRPRSVPEDVIRAVREATVREVPVYRRGSYEVVVDGEYRPTRRVEAGPRYFGLQPSAW